MKFEPELERRIRRAERAVAQLKPGFGRSMRERLPEMFDSPIAALTSGSDDPVRVLARLRTVAREIKGNAGAYGFETTSALADCLHAYLDTVESVDEQTVEIIRSHRDSIELSLSESLPNQERRRIEEFIDLSRELVRRVSTSSEER